MPNLPVIRSSERIDFKRCPKKWYWKWRKGLTPKAKTFGALELGTWMHTALADWYQEGTKRNGQLVDWFSATATHAISAAVVQNAPDYVVEKAEELAVLGENMATAYQRHYQNDKKIYVLGAEIPLEFTMAKALINGSWEPIAVHKLKPDLVFADENRDVWLMEHKTAKQVMTEHLVIDDQARPYGAMAERSLRKLGVISKRQQFRGILYNFLRKALPDERPQNSQGKYLNQDGSVSKRQPSPFFLRKPVAMTRQAKIITLQRVSEEAKVITLRTLELRTKELSPDQLPKTPHKSCPKTCQYFTMCVAEEEGTNIKDMERLMFVRQDPYLYEEESTEETLGFEIG